MRRRVPAVAMRRAGINGWSRGAIIMLCALGCFAVEEPADLAGPSRPGESGIAEDRSNRERRSELGKNCRLPPLATTALVAPTEAEKPLATPGKKALPKKPWLPNTIVEGQMTSAADLAFEIERLRGSAPVEPPIRPGAPSRVLLSVLEASQNTEEGGLKPPIPPTTAVDRRTMPGPSLASPSEKGEQEEVRPNRTVVQDQGGDYVAVALRGSLYVIDETAEEPLLLELEGGEVGRVKNWGEEWVWLQLESGLMGLMRHNNLRTATTEEIQEFLAMERLSEGARKSDEETLGTIDISTAELLTLSKVGKRGATTEHRESGLSWQRDSGQVDSASKGMKPLE